MKREESRRGPLAGLVAMAASILLSGCSSASHASDLLSITPDPRVQATAVAAREPLACDVLPEQQSKQGSHLQFAGPCAFTETAALQCVNKVDDFYAYVNRGLPNNGRLAVLINVEHYKGPGTYTSNSVIQFQVSTGGNLYIWQAQNVTLRVPAGEHELAVDAMGLPPLTGSPATGVETVVGVARCQ